MERYDYMGRYREIKDAAIEYSLYSDAIGEEYNSTEFEAFKEGAEWADEHPKPSLIDLNMIWIDAAQKEPEDGEYLTIIRTNGQTIIELAPWRNGKYQGRHHFGVEISRAEVIMYANVADLLPHTSRLIE